MKRTYIAAAALLLGTSAFAWAQSGAPVAPDAKDAVAAAKVDKSKDVKAIEAASAWSTEQAQVQPASVTTWQDEPAPGAGDPDLDLSEAPAAPKADSDWLAEPDPEAIDSGMTDAATGMGGPDESAEAVADASVAAELAPRPAAQNYPPCRPGPGDDNCIQLYEPGVRVALARWNQPTGGLAQPGEAMAAAEPLGEPEATAMGGPYEPVADDGADETAMAGDDVLEPEMGETEA